MHSLPFSIPNDIPTSLHPLIEQFCSDAFRILGVTQQTVRADICYLCRFFRHFGCPDSSSKLIQTVSSESIGNFLQDYAGTFSSNSLERMQIPLRSFLRFTYRFSLIDRDLSALVPTRKHRQLGTLPRSLPDECIARLRSGIERSSPARLRDSAITCLLAIYGIRGVQLRRLRLDDIDWREERIHFPAAKGSRPIEQHLMPEAGSLLLQYRSGVRIRGPGI